MRIAIDASRAVNEKAGIGRYTLELVRKLVEIDRKNEYLLLFNFMRSSSRKSKILQEFRKLPKVTVKTLKIPGAVKEKVWGWKLPWFKRIIQGADLYFAPSFLEINRGLKIPQVVTIYDLTTFLFPEHQGKLSLFFNRKTKEAVTTAKKVIAISNSTKHDLHKILKVPAGKVKVVYPGRNILPPEAKNLPGGLKNKSYILAVGTIEPRKNLVNLLKAYALLPQNLRNIYPLVVCGAKGWNTGETFDTLSHLNLEKKVRFLGFVSDAILAKLYKQAAVFVYPSLYEGFGFPVLEALSYGTPVITSDVSSMPEVAGKAALYVNPKDPKSIATALERVLEHRHEAQKLCSMAKAQAAKFTWEKAAKETLKVFNEI